MGWGISHTTTSPHYPQANEMAEKFVQTVECLLNKVKQDNQDPYMTLLIYQNTNIDNIASAAQMLMDRRLRTNLTIMNNQLEPKTVASGKVNGDEDKCKPSKSCTMTMSIKITTCFGTESENASSREMDTCNCTQHCRHTSLLCCQDNKWETYRRNRCHLMKCLQEDESSLRD